MKLSELIARIDALIRGHATGVIEMEYLEMEHIFALLILGQFVGLPAPPPQITLDLLPVMESHLILLIRRTEVARGPLSELFSTLEVR